ncbi:MAG: tetratricopeptide repeat protein [Terriglobales bacterium]
MKRAVLVMVLLAAVTAGAQITRILIPAGTPEDQALQTISNEADPAKRVAMLEEFVQKFADNPQAVAYGDWQLSQQHLAQGNAAKALEYGQKAMAMEPNNLEILAYVAGIAQQLKRNDVVMASAVQGGQAFNAAVKSGTSQLDVEAAQPSYDYLEAAALSAIQLEQDPKTRMVYIEQYVTAFPNSKYQDQVNQYTIITLQQLNDPQRLAQFAKKVVAANPSASTYVLLASVFAESSDPADALQAEHYSERALELSKTLADPKKQRLTAGLAHSALGYALLKRDRTAAAIAELKLASGVLKEDANAYSTVLYRLGFAYAKANQLAEAKVTLTEAATVSGPFQGPSKELLAKVETALAKRKK